MEDGQEGKRKKVSDVQTAIYRYCNYQERSHSEVRNKLYELGCYPEQVESLITELIEKDLLNEERFACSFARGKFRMKQWGRNKIVQELKARKISDYCIKKAMQELDSSEYDITFLKLADKRWESLQHERNQANKKAKTYRYLLQKGYESGKVLSWIAAKIAKS